MSTTTNNSIPRRATLASPPIIQPDAMYRSDEIQRRLGWKTAAWRAAVKNGLRVFRKGRRVFCLGSDVVAFITATEPKGGSTHE